MKLDCVLQQNELLFEHKQLTLFKEDKNMSEIKYYYCTICGNVIEKVHDSKNTPMCCMRDMEELVACSTDGKTEFHVPVYKIHRDKLVVCIGKEPHPMEKDHYIEWIEVETNKGIMRRYLKPGDNPTAHFHLCDKEEVLKIYAYCNKHKLWSCAFEKEHQYDCCDEYDRYTCD